MAAALSAEILSVVLVLHRPLLPVLCGMQFDCECWFWPEVVTVVDGMDVCVCVQVMLIARFVSCTNNLRTCSVTGLQAVLCVINFVEALVRSDRHFACRINRCLAVHNVTLRCAVLCLRFLVCL